jgi:hypothetical protein
MSDTIEAPALADTTAIEYSPARLRVEAHLMIVTCMQAPIAEANRDDEAADPFAANDERLARWIVEKAEEAYQQGIADTIDLMGGGDRIQVSVDGKLTEAIVRERPGVTP